MKGLVLIALVAAPLTAYAQDVPPPEPTPAPAPAPAPAPITITSGNAGKNYVNL